LVPLPTSAPFPQAAALRASATAPTASKTFDRIVISLRPVLVRRSDGDQCRSRMPSSGGCRPDGSTRSALGRSSGVVGKSGMTGITGWLGRKIIAAATTARHRPSIIVIPWSPIATRCQESATASTTMTPATSKRIRGSRRARLMPLGRISYLRQRSRGHGDDGPRASALLPGLSARAELSARPPGSPRCRRRATRRPVPSRQPTRIPSRQPTRRRADARSEASPASGHAVHPGREVDVPDRLGRPPVAVAALAEAHPNPLEPVLPARKSRIVRARGRAPGTADTIRLHDAADPRPLAGERAEAGPSLERTAPGVTAPGHLSGGALGRRREIAGAPGREWRGSPAMARRSRRGEAEPEVGRRVTRARASS
jgi:hypothetical protein